MVVAKLTLRYVSHNKQQTGYIQSLNLPQGGKIVHWLCPFVRDKFHVWRVAYCQDNCTAVSQNITTMLVLTQTLINQGLSKHQEMGFTPVMKVLQSNEGTLSHTRTITNVSIDRP